ncbi:MAG: FRG domain-containing protein [Methylomarinum sp.]|nr:FRG domain-containing protein [Methylomarinum sp.]
MSSSVGRVASITSFIKRIKKIESRKGYTLFYRGHSDDSYESVPSVFREIKNGSSVGTYADKEDTLFKNMVIQCPQEFVGCSSTLEYLVKMQHYGLPTRLLDLTTNPLVALYFSCCSHYGTGKVGRNGEVLVYEVPDEDIKFFNSDTAAVIGNLAKMPRNFEYLKDKGRFLHEIQAEKPYFKDGINVKHLNSVQCVKAKLDNRRITQQSGAFFIFGMKNTITQPAEIPYPYLCKRDNNTPVSIGVSQAGKKVMLSELSELSISEASLFPEIDSVARYLKNEVVEAL